MKKDNSFASLNLLHTCTDESGAVMPLKLLCIMYHVGYMSGNDLAPVHTGVKRGMMSRLRGSS